MNKSTIKSNRKIVFNRKEDAEKTLRQAKEIAYIYGYVTMADICDFIDATSIYTESLFGWTPDAIEKTEILEDFYVDVRGGMNYRYILHLPQCDWEKYGHTKEAENTEEPSTGEPINITISSGEWDTRRNDIEQVFNELFRNSDKIKDRPVFINIM